MSESIWRWFVGVGNRPRTFRVWAEYTILPYGFDCWNDAVRHALIISGVGVSGRFSGCPKCKDDPHHKAPAPIRARKKGN